MSRTSRLLRSLVAATAGSAAALGFVALLWPGPALATGARTVISPDAGQTTAAAPANSQSAGAEAEVQRLSRLEASLATASAAGKALDPKDPKLAKLAAVWEQVHAALVQEAISLSSQAAAEKQSAVNAAVASYVASAAGQTAGSFLTSNVNEASTRSVYLGLVSSIAKSWSNRDSDLAKAANQSIAALGSSFAGFADSSVAGAAPRSGTTTPSLSAAASSTPDLSIMGSSTLSAQELASWYESFGYQNNTGMPIAQLAQLYLDEGSKAGVRGDVAFAQSILETGGFSIMSGKNNFAGIGACDSCHGGYDFSSVRQGVAAQVQLLRAYADASYSTSSFSWVNTLSIKGEHPTWTSLSKSWSSSESYGSHVLSIYLSILTDALAP